LISRTLFLVFLISILLSAGFFSTVNAQSPGSKNVNNSQDKSQSAIIPNKSIGLRITSPLKGDQFFINGLNYLNKNGEKLSIHGTSTASANNTSTCGVSIIANGVKPYQLANGTGPKGKTDFSSWMYYFPPSYATLKEGSNKITSKLSCQPGNLVAYYSVNVTGIKSTGTLSSSVGKLPVNQSKFSNNSTAPPLSTNNKNISAAPLSQLTLPLYPSSNQSSPFTPSNSTAPPLSTNNKNISAAPLSQSNTSSLLEPKSMDITLDKKENGRAQTIVITVKDSITDKPIGGVNLSGNINDVTFSGITNSSGEFSKIIPSSIIKSSSTIDVTVTASANGYKSNKANTSFDITTSSSSATETKTKSKSGAKDMAAKIAKDVQSQLSKQGINIPLPFG
jgi:hypothetical protein